MEQDQINQDITTQQLLENAERRSEAYIQAAIKRAQEDQTLKASKVLSVESSKTLANKVFNTYDTNQTSKLNSLECAHLITNTYKKVGTNFVATNSEGVGLMKAADYNTDRVYFLTP